MPRDLTPARRGFTAINGTRSADAPDHWPFAPMDEIQQRNHDRARAAARALNDRARAERIRELVNEAKDALL